MAEDAEGRVLFVDDEPAARAAFARSVRSSGLAVETVSSGKEAIERATERAYAVIATDVCMPGIDGVSLIHRLRPIQPNASFVIVTGLPDADRYCATLPDGVAVSVITKPWDQRELVRVLHDAINRQPADGSNVPPVPDFEPAILLIEDNPADARLVRAFLEETKLNQKVLDEVARLEEALVRLDKGSFDVVICDLNLPDAWGLDTLKRLQAAAPEPAVIVLSGVDDDALGLEAVQLGAQDYLTKGRIDAHTLERSIRYATERKRTQTRLAHLARHDELTGLTNRHTFAEHVAVAIGRAERYGAGFSVMFLDLDRFKTINDSLGHNAGDHVLAVAAARVCAAVRECDTVARLGGDEFGVLVENVSDTTATTEIAERIVAGLAVPVCLTDGEVIVTTSIGIALYPDDGRSVERLLKAADAGMYAAKATGRNTYRFASNSDLQPVESRLRLEQDLLKAVENEEFQVYFQPQVCLETRKVVGYEALLRWRRPDGSQVPPEKIVPVLEELGLINRVGRWVLQTACRQLKSWRATSSRDLRIAVNLSARQFNETSLVPTVEQTLRDVGLDSRALELEITEGLLMRDTERTRRALGDLKSLGVRLAVDDFGTGYSSLAYLERFAVDVLKIDQSFVRGAPASRRRAAITGAILGLGHGLGLQVVAEGVETEEELRYLRAEGCDLAQGFLLGAPAPRWEAPAPPKAFHVELPNSGLIRGLQVEASPR